MHDHPLARIDVWAALVAILVALAAPLMTDNPPSHLLTTAGVTGGVIGVIVIYGALATLMKPGTVLADIALAVGAALGGGLALNLLPTVAGKASDAYWGLVAASGLLAFHLLRRLIARAGEKPVARVAFAPLAVVVAAVLILAVWEAADRGAALASIPPPSALAAKAGINLPDLWARLHLTTGAAPTAGG